MSQDNELSNIIRDLEKMDRSVHRFLDKECSDLHGRIIQLPRTDRRQLYKDEEYLPLEEVLDWQQTCPQDTRITDAGTNSEENIRIAFEISKRVAIWRGEASTIECDAVLRLISSSDRGSATRRGMFIIYRVCRLPANYIYEPRMVSFNEEIVVEFLTLATQSGCRYLVIDLDLFVFEVSYERREAILISILSQVRKWLERNYNLVDKIILCARVKEYYNLQTEMMLTYFPVYVANIPDGAPDPNKVLASTMLSVSADESVLPPVRESSPQPGTSRGDHTEVTYTQKQNLSPDERDTFSSMELARPKPRSQRAAPACGFSDLNGEEVADVEGGQIVSKFLCEGYGPLDRPFTSLGRFLSRQSPQRLLIIGATCVGILGLILFVSLLPASFVYVEYHEVALSQSKMTHEVDREKVFYPGCYVLGPDTQLIRFQATAHSINKVMEVFTKDTIIIKMGFSLQYFLRPTEVALLYSKFMMDYEAIFDKIVDSSIKNIAGAEIAVDDFRFNRTSVETILHAIVRRRLGGTCCPACCPRNCQSNTYCSSCSHGNCDLGYHIDVRFFHLLSVDIPQEVFEKYLQRTLLGIESEKEYFLQDHALTLKETELLTKKVTNEAAELVESGNAEAKKILQVAEADREVVVQKSYNGALKSFYTSLNVTSEDHKLSLMMIRALDDAHENLYRGYGFEHNTLYKP